MVLLAGGASKARAEYPALYQSGRFKLSTLDQFETRIRSLHPEFTIEVSRVESLQNGGKSFPGMTIETDGIKSGTRVVQKLTYIQEYPGLWKIILVDNKFCIRGKAINSSGDFEAGWKCEDDPFPIKGFLDVYILENEEVAIDLIQPAFKDPIVAIEAPKDQKQKQEVLKSLADVKKELDSLGTSMKVEQSLFQDINNPTPTPSVSIFVSGTMKNRMRVTQEFIYLIDGVQLRLKAVDGERCQFEESMNKDICEPANFQTSATPLPLKLLNSWEESGVEVAETLENPESEPEVRCGQLKSHMDKIMQVHFERSIFKSASVEEIKRFVSNFPMVADPMGLFLSSSEKQELLNAWQQDPEFEDKVTKLSAELKKGEKGECRQLNQWVNEINQLVLGQNGEVLQALNQMKEVKFSLEDFAGLAETPVQKKVLEKLSSVLDPKRVQVSEEQAVDVAAGKIRRYLNESLARLQDFEEFVVSAMAMQDVYSHLVVHPEGVQTSLTGFNKRLYFGVSIETGLSGRHYMAAVHPQVEKELGLRFGQEIKTFNGTEASTLSSQYLDRVLLDTKNSIDLVMLDGSQESEVVLTASEINPADQFFEIQVKRKARTWLTIKLKSFEAGVTQAILEQASAILDNEPIDGFELDLRNNPGGSIDEAVNIMSLFVKNRIVTYYRLGARNVAQLKAFHAKPHLFLDDTLPLIVKVNRKSMSSSEIVASGLQALKRSTTVGEKTFGKLVGQFYSPLVLENKKNTGLLLTSFEFYNVDGEALNGIGVTPDLVFQGEEGSDFYDGLGEAKNLKLEEMQEVERYDFEQMADSSAGQSL